MGVVDHLSNAFIFLVNETCPVLFLGVPTFLTAIIGISTFTSHVIHLALKFVSMLGSAFNTNKAFLGSL